MAPCRVRCCTCGTLADVTHNFGLLERGYSFECDDCLLLEHQAEWCRIESEEPKFPKGLALTAENLPDGLPAGTT